MYTPLDTLYLVLSVSIVVITVCIVWLFVYVLVILKRFHDVQRVVLDRVNAVGRVFDTLREKIEHSSSHIALLVELATRAFEYFKTKRKSTKQKAKAEE